jgi:hypothetical protein
MFLNCCSPNTRNSAAVCCRAASNRPGNQYATRFGQRVQAGRNVDTIAEDVFLIEDDFAKIYADAELDFPVWRDVGIAIGHFPLDRNGANQRIGHHVEFGEHCVAGVVGHSSGMAFDQVFNRIQTSPQSRCVPSSSAPDKRLSATSAAGSRRAFAVTGDWSAFWVRQK